MADSKDCLLDHTFHLGGEDKVRQEQEMEHCQKSPNGDLCSLCVVGHMCKDTFRLPCCEAQVH